MPPGPPLVPDGETEAAKLGEFLRAAGVTKVYASPLERTRRTAEIVGEVSGARQWKNSPPSPNIAARKMKPPCLRAC
ncbi:MAG: histidine phosphatase family protein [Caldilineaceae bacterium]